MWLHDALMGAPALYDGIRSLYRHTRCSTDALTAITSKIRFTASARLVFPTLPHLTYTTCTSFGLARALSTDADILLMDEAFSALDPLIRTDMQDVLLDLQKELHKTVIFITHDLDEALRIGDNITILRDGEVIQQGNPQEIILNPADEYVSDFIQDINRPRVLQIGSIADPKGKSEGPSMDAETVVEDALQKIISSKANGINVLKDGKPIGAASLEQLIHAIARPTGEKKGIESYR